MPTTGAPDFSLRSRRRWLLVLVIFVYALSLQGVRPLYDPDEGRYTAGAISMLRTGDWMTPRWNEEAYNLTKPPLTYWAIASSFRLLGRSETAARLPNSLAFGGTILLVFLIAERLAPDKALVASCVYATALFPVVAANIVSTDTLLALWETLAVFGYVAARWGSAPSRWGSAPSRWGIPSMWLGFGLAFLTKGPPGLLPLLSILAFSGWTDGWRGLRRLFAPLGLALFAIVGLGWYLAEILRIPGLLDYFWSFEIVGRLQGVQNRNPGLHGLLVTYLPVALFGLLPWAAIWFFPGQRRSRGEAANVAGPATTRFLWLWIVIPLGVFTLAQSRIALYLLPLMVPAALWLARGIRIQWSKTATRIWLVLWVVGLFTLRSASLFYAHPTKDGRVFADDLRSLVGGRPDNVLFVDVPSRWTLVFYLDCEVREVDLYRPQAGEELADRFQLRQPLARALASASPSKVLLVQPSKVDALKRRLNELSVDFKDSGSTHGFEVLRVSSTAAGSIDGSQSQSKLAPV